MNAESKTPITDSRCRITPNPEYTNAPYEEQFFNQDGTAFHPPWMGSPRRFPTKQDALNQTNEIPAYIIEGNKTSA
jgi:hypothetical protein